MRRDRKAPALYELIKARPKLGPLFGSPPRAVAAPPASAPEEKHGWFSPGRSLRFPVGYAIPAALGVLVLAVVGYILGYKARDTEEQRLREQDAARQLADTTDPLLRLPVNGALVNTDPALNSRSASGPQSSTSKPPPSSGVGRAQPQTKTPPPPPRTGAPPGASSEKAGPGPGSGRLPEGTTRVPGVVAVTGSGDDPRQPGMNYLIAATLPTDEAEKAAAFLSSRGLEIAVVPVDNRPSQRWVVVLQAFGSREWYGPEGKRLEEQIKSLGREYQQQFKGPSVFRDPWWKKHTK